MCLNYFQYAKVVKFGYHEMEHEKSLFLQRFFKRIYGTFSQSQNSSCFGIFQQPNSCYAPSKGKNFKNKPVFAIGRKSRTCFDKTISANRKHLIL